VSRYALLLLPSANRVYADAAVDLTVAELEAFNDSVLDGRLGEIGPAVIGGVPYVTFTASPGELPPESVAYLSNASSMYALFAVEGDLLRPVALSPLAHFDDDLVTIQKYQGKTNEQFTRLLLNVTLLASSAARRMLDRRLRVLDPLCGRGTTLNTALIYGYDVAGLDIDGKDYEAYGAFIQTYLKRKKVKHKAESAPVRRERRTIGRRLHVTLAATREAHRAGDTMSFEIVHADTTRATEFFRPDSFDLVVADAPYGVQHGSRTEARGLARGPLDLLRAAAPGWASLLRPGGAMGIAWNTYVASRADAAAVLEKVGLTVVDSGPYLRLRHRVDQSIVRDILVARRPA
jgi:SAM-dependent methyltransferase